MEDILPFLASSGFLHPTDAVTLGYTLSRIWNCQAYWEMQWAGLNLGEPNLARDGNIVVSRHIADFSRWSGKDAQCSVFQLHFQIIDSADPACLQGNNPLSRAIERILGHSADLPERIAFFMSRLTCASVLGHNLIFLERMYRTNVVSRTTLKRALNNQLALPDFAGSHYRRPFFFLFIHLFPKINEVFAIGFRLFLSIDPMTLIMRDELTSCKDNPLTAFLKRADFNSVAYELFKECMPTLWDLSPDSADDVSTEPACSLAHASADSAPTESSSVVIRRKSILTGDYAILSISIALKSVFGNAILQSQLTDATYLLQCLELMLEHLGAERSETAVLGIYTEEPHIFKLMRPDAIAFLPRWISDSTMAIILGGDRFTESPTSRKPALTFPQTAYRQARRIREKFKAGLAHSFGRRNSRNRAED